MAANKPTPDLKTLLNDLKTAIGTACTRSLHGGPRIDKETADLLFDFQESLRKRLDQAKYEGTTYEEDEELVPDRERMSAEADDAAHEHLMAAARAAYMVTKLVYDESVPDAERAAAIRRFLELVDSRDHPLAVLESAPNGPLLDLIQRLSRLPTHRHNRPKLRVVPGGTLNT